MTTKKEEEMLDLIKTTVKTFNKLKGTKLKVYEVTFGLGSDREYKPDTLVTTATVIIQNKEKNKTIKLHFSEAAFDAKFPWHWDEPADVSKATTDKNKVILRIAYCIWFNRNRIL